MQPKALIFGSLGTLAETGELERNCFNRAFREAGLSWVWDAETYALRLHGASGPARIADYAAERGEAVDAEALHTAKMTLFADIVQRDGVMPRAGVEELAAAARAEGIVLALASVKSPESVRLTLDGLHPALKPSDFAFIGDGTKAVRPKPAPDIYEVTLRTLGLSPGEAVALEDAPGGAEAAQAAGIMTYAVPSSGAENLDFPGVMAVLDRLDPGRILALDPAKGMRPITEGERTIDS